jgi:hypothetical protein
MAAEEKGRLAVMVSGIFYIRDKWQLLALRQMPTENMQEKREKDTFQLTGVGANLNEFVMYNVKMGATNNRNTDFQLNH